MVQPTHFPPSLAAAPIRACCVRDRKSTHPLDHAPLRPLTPPAVLPWPVWFYYSKSLNCCLEVRAILDGGSGACLPAFATPCNEFVGDCADLIAQFSSVGPDQGGLPTDYVCTQVFIVHHITIYSSSYVAVCSGSHCN